MSAFAKLTTFMPSGFPQDALTINEALALIEGTPAYEQVGAHLNRLAERGRIHVRETMEDRARANLLGSITLGPEAIKASPLSLAQTLVHEHFHLRQNPFLKTISFWSGVFTRTHPMRRYEQPAYQAAIDFLEAAKTAHPHLAEEASAEQRAVHAGFAAGYGSSLK